MQRETKKFGGFEKSLYFCIVIMEQEQVIQRIKELGEKILPEGASLWLYGSRALVTPAPTATTTY